jgi:hypothetical protein
MPKRLPSPSMIVALLALVVALGGTAYAASQINGSTIKNGTISGKKLKTDTLSGKQIKESTLGTVPSASRAGTATSAGSATNAGHANTADNATAIGGVGLPGLVQGGGQTFSNGMTQVESTVDTQVFTLPGIGTLTMGCSSTANTDFTLVNGTGATVQLTDAGNYFLSGTGVQTESGGRDAAPNADLISDLPLTTGQFHVSADWPAGSPVHGADFTIGWFKDTSNKCELTVAGFVR